MDDLHRHPTYDMDDSPAAAVKTRTRVKRKRATSKDNEPQPATKRKYDRKKKGPVEAKIATPADGARLFYEFPGQFSRADLEADDSPPPLQTPLFGMHSPHESWSAWLGASGSPSPTNSVKFHQRSANFYSSFEPSVPNIPVDERNKPRRKEIDLSLDHVSPVRVPYAPKGSMNNPGPFVPSKHYSFATTPPPRKAGSYAIHPYTSSSTSGVLPSGTANGSHRMGNQTINSTIHSSRNKELQMNQPTSGTSGTESSIPKSPHLLSCSSANLPQMGKGSTESLGMAFEGLEPSAVVEWQPAGLLSIDSQGSENQYALLILNQPIQNLNMLKLVWEKAFFRIAADGGANRLSDAFKDPCLNEDFERIGLEVICGDLDSLFTRVREDAQRRGTRIVGDPDQYSTDFTKCIAYLRQKVFNRHRAVSNIVCLGGLGGRVDQGLSQLHHLYMEQQDPHYKNGRIYLLSTEGLTFVLKKGKHRIRVHDPTAPILGKHIGIIPLREPSIITTKGLEWDVTEWPTAFGDQISTSNHVREDVVEITTTGDVLFTIDLNFPPGNHEHPEVKRELTPPIISMEDDIFFGIETNRYSY